MVEHRSMKELRLAVVGTGALGSAVLYKLGTCGVRDVLLIDPDCAEERNLRLSPFLREAAARRNGCSLHKAALLAGEGQRRWNLPWKAICAEIADTGWQHITDRDLLLCCTDSALSRAEAAWTGRTLGKPLIEAGVFGSGIEEYRVSWFPPSSEAACYLCGMREERRAQVLAYAASASLGCAPLEDAPAMTGTPEALSRAAHATMDLLEAFARGRAPIGNSTAHRSSMLTEGWYESELMLTHSQDCPWHEPLRGAWIPLPWDVPLRESLRNTEYSSVLLQLLWQVCVRAHCVNCGRCCEPFARVAAVRRKLRCPHCEHDALEPLANISTVREQDSLAGRSPRQLGQPDRHLYLLRKPLFWRDKE